MHGGADEDVSKTYRTKIERVNMGNTKRQHYVPQRYLKQFSYSQEKPYLLYALRKNTCKIFNPSIKDVALEKDFYTIEQSIDKYIWENFYGQYVEPNLSSTLKKVITACNSVHTNSICLTEQDKQDLTEHIVIQLFRDKMVREYFKKFRDLMLPSELNKIIDKLPKDKKLLVNRKNCINFIKSEEFCKQFMLKIACDENRIKKFVSLIMLRVFVVCKVKRNCEFITSDHPVMIMNMDNFSVEPYQNGIISSDSTILFPLFPELILIMFPPTLPKKLDRRMIVFDNKKEIEIINHKQFEQCYDKVFAKSRITLESLL